LMAEYWPDARLVGVDAAEVVRSIRLPRLLRRRVEVRAGDLTTAWPSEHQNGRFDVAVCHGVLHTRTDPAALLQGIARALRPGGELVGATFTDAYQRALRARLEAAGVTFPLPEIRHTPAQIAGALITAGFTAIETWTEDVELQVDGPAATAHLDRILGRSLGPGEAERLLGGTGGSLYRDFSPLSFRATAPGVDRGR
jgi:SAM-dependent methyltransferase